MPTAETFTRYAPLLKASPTGYVLCPVLVPDRFDQAGDLIDEADVEAAMQSFAVNGRQIDLMHQEMLSEKDVQVMESYVSRSDSVINGVPIPRGTWLLGLQLSPRLREMVKSRKINGLSIRGSGVRTPIE